MQSKKKNAYGILDYTGCKFIKDQILEGYNFLFYYIMDLYYGCMLAVLMKISFLCI